MSYYVIYAAVVAALAPLALVTTRWELRKVRLALINDLKKTLFKTESGLPQIELVVHRYNQDENGRFRQSNVKLRTGAIFFFLISLIGFLILLMPRSELISLDGQFPSLGPSLLWSSVDSDIQDVGRALTVIGFAFLGGYVLQLRYLIRTVLNQELSALAFVRSTLNIVQGMIIAALMYRIVEATFGSTMEDDGGGLAGLLATAFVIGAWPHLGLGYIVKLARIQTKRVGEVALRKSALVPLEVIDGIDTETSFRLEESNLYDVQNLASINPLQLYAETPYSLHQIFDWVLQAQLCTTVGPSLFRELRKHGIRTIFDLERAVVAKGAPDSYVAALGGVLLADSSSPFYELVEPWEDSGKGIDPEIVRHVVAILIDDLHIHNLRALWRTMIKATSDGANQPWLFETYPLPGDADYKPPPRHPRRSRSDGPARPARAKRPGVLRRVSRRFGFGSDQETDG